MDPSSLTSMHLWHLQSDKNKITRTNMIVAVLVRTRQTSASTCPCVFITLFRSWVTGWLIDPIHTNNRNGPIPFQHTDSPRTDTHGDAQFTLKHFPNGHTGWSPPSLCTFYSKSFAFQERHMETCKWLLDIPVEKLTVNWKGNVSFYIKQSVFKKMSGVPCVWTLMSICHLSSPVFYL